MGSIDMSQNQNGISSRFSSQNSSQIVYIELPPWMHLLAAAVAAAVAGDEVVVLDVTGGESVTGSLLI